MRAACGWVEAAAQLDAAGQVLLVGGTGYVINLAVFASPGGGRRRPLPDRCGTGVLRRRHEQLPLEPALDLQGDHSHAGFQALASWSSACSRSGFNLVVLELLVSVGDVPKIPAQAIAILAATPLNFVGNKLWSFRQARQPPRRATAWRGCAIGSCAGDCSSAGSRARGRVPAGSPSAPDSQAVRPPSLPPSRGPLRRRSRRPSHVLSARSRRPAIAARSPKLQERAREARARHAIEAFTNGPEPLAGELVRRRQGDRAR